METLTIVLVFAAAAGVVLWLLGEVLHRRWRLWFIRSFRWPEGLLESLKRHFPHLSPGEREYVGKALKQFFIAKLKSGRRPVSMPSKIAGMLWLEFTQDKQAYERFCKIGLGTVLPHVPSVSLDRVEVPSNAGLRRMWILACREEGIDPLEPKQVRKLFGLDQLFGVSDKAAYDPDKDGLRERTEMKDIGTGDGALWGDGDGGGADGGGGGD